MAGKGSDIIKIGFDYRSSLNKFKQETDNTFDDVQKEGKRIIINLNANDADIKSKIDKLQNTKFKNITLEFDDKPIDRQIELLGDLQNMVLNIVNLFNKGYKTDDIIDASKTLSEIDKLTKKLDDVSHKYDDLSQKIADKSGNNVDLADNTDFKELSEKINSAKSEIKDLRDTVSQLSQGSVSDSKFFDELETKLNSVSKETTNLTQNLIDLQKTYKNLSNSSNDRKKESESPDDLVKDNTKASAQLEIYNELKDAIKDYSTISKRIASENLFEGDYEEAVRLENKIEELQNHPLLSQSQIDSAQRSLNQLGAKIDEITNKLKISKNDAISNISNKIDSFNVNGFSSNDFNSKYGSQIADLNAQLERGEIKVNDYNSKCNTLISTFEKLVKSGNKISVLEGGMTEAGKAAHKFSEDFMSGATIIEKGTMKSQNGISTMTDTIRVQNGEILKLKYTYLDGFLAMSNVTTKFKTQATGISRIFEELKGKVGDLAVYWTANLFNPYDLILPIKSATSNVINLNTELTDLSKVSDESIGQLYKDFDEFSTIAKDVGGTISDTISATADWARNGYGLPDSEELARVALIYKNVGDGIDIDAANESLISTLRGFQLETEDAMHIIDVFNEVSNNNPISSSGIGEALQRSAASFNAANTSLEKSVALVTATNSVLQDTSKTGNMWRTVSARLRGADTELKNMGEDTDGLVKSTSKLRELVKGITGFDIMVDENTFKDIYEIILGIGNEWKDLNDINKAALLEALAGKQQSNALAATLDNVDILKDAYEDATNAEGSAMREQEKYQESVQYSIDRTKASLEELSNDFMSSNFLKGIIDFGNGAINILDELLSTLGSVPTTLGSIMGALTLFKNIGRRNVVLTISLSIV